MNENELHVKIYYYPLDHSEFYKYYDDWRVIRAFYFRPRVFKGGGATYEALEKVMTFIEEKLSKAGIEIEAEIEIEGEIEEELELKMKGLVSLSSSLKIKSNELKELYRKLYDKLSKRYKNVRVLITFYKPIRIPLTKEDYKRLFEELLNTKAQLNVETARRLFGKEFAKRVSEHNRQIRASKN